VCLTRPKDSIGGRRGRAGGTREGKAARRKGINQVGLNCSPSNDPHVPPCVDVQIECGERGERGGSGGERDEKNEMERRVFARDGGRGKVRSSSLVSPTSKATRRRRRGERRGREGGSE
jgi:hypothetical protein